MNQKMLYASLRRVLVPVVHGCTNDTALKIANALAPEVVLVGIVRALTGLETIVAATGLSLLVCVATARVAWPLLGRNLRAYTLFSAFLLAGPFSIWFTTFYTEVLFLFLTVCVFAALQARRILLAGVFAALLSATRIVGVFIVFAIVIEIWLAHRAAGGSWRCGWRR